MSTAFVDCDVHVAPTSFDQLAPYLSDHWRDYVDGARIQLSGMPGAYPAGAATTGRDDGGGRRPTPSRYEKLKEQHLDGGEVELAILNCLTLFPTHRHPYFVAALASALNDWMREEWLARDDRLRGSVAVSTLDPDDAVAEIERVGSDPRFVQILLPARADSPWGNKRFHRIFEAAAEHELAVAIHAWGRPVSAPTPSGLTFTYLEDYLSNQLIAQSHVLSLVNEGVFARVPDLRVCLAECGFAWLPPLLWRWDKDWKGLWREVPWVKEEPSAYVRRHFRATTAPAFMPADRGQAAELLEMVGTDWLMYASDFPHDHGPSIEAVFDVVDDAAARRIRVENARAFYRLDRQTGGQAGV